MSNNERHLVRIRGYATTGATAGNLQFQWAQNAGSFNPTSVEVNSFLKVGQF